MADLCVDEAGRRGAEEAGCSSLYLLLLHHVFRPVTVLRRLSGSCDHYLEQSLIPDHRVYPSRRRAIRQCLLHPRDQDQDCPNASPPGLIVSSLHPGLTSLVSSTSSSPRLPPLPNPSSTARPSASSVSRRPRSSPTSAVTWTTPGWQSRPVSTVSTLSLAHRRSFGNTRTART